MWRWLASFRFTFLSFEAEFPFGYGDNSFNSCPFLILIWIYASNCLLGTIYPPKSACSYFGGDFISLDNVSIVLLAPMSEAELVRLLFNYGAGLVLSSCYSRSWFCVPSWSFFVWSVIIFSTFFLPFFLSGLFLFF